MKNSIEGRRLFFLLVVSLCFLVGILSEGFAEQKTLVILSASDGLPDRKIISPYIPEFEKETGYKVEWTEMAIGPLHQKLATLFAAQSSEVDIVWTWKGWTAEFGNAGYLEDITDKIEPELKSDLNAAMNAVTYKDRIYGLPKFLSIRYFYYNKRMFEEAGLEPNKPPTNWDEVVEYAQKTTRDLDGDGKTDQWGILLEYGRENSCVMVFQELLTGAGGTMFDLDDNPVFGGPEGLMVLENLAELHRLGVVDPASFGIASGGDKRSNWVQGKAAMELGWAADYHMSNNPEESKVVDEVGFTLIPAMKLKSGAMSGSEGYVISKFSKNKDAALEFLKFVAKKENQKDMTLRTGWMPVRTSVFDDSELQAANPLVAQTAEQIKYPVYRFGAPYAEEVTNMLGPEILNVVKLEKEPKKALEDAVKAAKEIVERYK